MRFELLPIYGEVLHNLMAPLQNNEDVTTSIDKVLQEHVGIDLAVFHLILREGLASVELDSSVPLETLCTTAFTDGFILALFMMKHEFYTGKDRVDEFITNYSRRAGETDEPS